MRTLPVATALAGYAALQWLGRTYGATRQERRRRLPGDELCAAPQAATTHAITIDAPPERVWPWLVQMGWGRGQWYTARWVDRLLFPANGPSADRLVAEWQHLHVGDRILDGPPEAECSFVVSELEPARHLVLHSHEHLPPGWAEKYGAAIDWSWAFVLDRLRGDRTRFVVRSRFHLEPRWIEAFYLAVMVPADFVMARQMLRGVRARAEATTADDVAQPGPKVPETAVLRRSSRRAALPSVGSVGALTCGDPAAGALREGDHHAASARSLRRRRARPAGRARPPQLGRHG